MFVICFYSNVNIVLIVMPSVFVPYGRAAISLKLLLVTYKLPAC
jgi:hypothetical protein